MVTFGERSFLLKLALITDGITPYVMGGMQRHSANLAKYLTLAGIEVSLLHCVPYGENPPSAEKVNEELFGPLAKVELKEVICLEFPKNGKFPGHYIRRSYSYSKMVTDALDYSKIDFIYAKGFAAWDILKRKKKGQSFPPVGVKFHGYEMFQLSPSLKQKVDGALLRPPTKWNNVNADYVFSYGGKITELIKELGVTDDKILEFTSGIDSNVIRKDDRLNPIAPVKFVFVGRSEIRKGVNEIHEAIQLLIEAGENFEAHFIGPIVPFIENDALIFHGTKSSLNDITLILDQMDVLLCPSHSEGMPNVIIEGMARELAVLTTKVGAIEVIVNDENGVFCSPGNAQSLHEAMLKFIHMNKDSLKKMRTTSKKIVIESLAWERLAESLSKKLISIKS